LTPEGVRFLLFSGAVGLAAINTGNNLLYLLLAMMLSLIVVSGILSEQCIKQLIVRRGLPPHVFAGEPTTLTMTITNQKRALSSFSLRVMDVVGGLAVDRGIHVLHLPQRSTAAHAYPVLMTQRGRHRIDGVKLLTRFPFGIFIKAVTMPLESELVVYPECRPLPSMLVQDVVRIGTNRSVSRRGQGPDLYNLRLYQSGDDSRMIHWMSTARTAKLIVRETEAEDQRRVLIELPTHLPGEEPAAFERAVTLAASLASWFCERDYTVRAVVGRQEVPAGIGRRQLYRILRRLALCELDASGRLEGGKVRGPAPRRHKSGEELTLLVWPTPCPFSALPGGFDRVLFASELI
jgi:uncharacterized protein (DUF58 family)